jgi:hypothetical protein
MLEITCRDHEGKKINFISHHVIIEFQFIFITYSLMYLSSDTLFYFILKSNNVICKINK